MALNGRAGHIFSHAPHPMQRSVFTQGIFVDSSPFCGVMMMAPVGHTLAHLPHDMLSFVTRQFSFIHTA
jgi:hypothetical protein